jgi:hypothetical protein
MVTLWIVEKLLEFVRSRAAKAKEHEAAKAKVLREMAKLAGERSNRAFKIGSALDKLVE